MLDQAVAKWLTVTIVRGCLMLAVGAPASCVLWPMQVVPAIVSVIMYSRSDRHALALLGAMDQLRLWVCVCVGVFKHDCRMCLCECECV